MPRRNSATLSTKHRAPATHVVVDQAGRIISSGRKAECNELAEFNNSALGTWAYRVQPIHK